MDFYYGADRQRWKEVYTGPNGVETTYHAGKLFEVAYYGGLAHYRHYVYAGIELVSIDDASTASSPQYYVVSDHQGSIASIENSASPGTNFVSESFTAFGNRRNGETWSGAPTSADESNINSVSRMGYTQQTALGVSMGLIHMNGRIADAITGRFLSPDPNTPNSGNTQSWNRYSYVNNNPLTMTDPTGFAPKGNCDRYCPGDYYWSGAASGIATVSDGMSAVDDSFGSIYAPDWFDSDLGLLYSQFPSSNTTGSATVGAPIAGDNNSGQSGSGSTSTNPTTTTDPAASGTTTPSSGTAQSQGTVQGPTLDEITVAASRYYPALSSDFFFEPAVFPGVSSWTILGNIAHRAAYIALLHANPSLAARLTPEVQIPGGGQWISVWTIRLDTS